MGSRHRECDTEGGQMWWAGEFILCSNRSIKSIISFLECYELCQRHVCDEQLNFFTLNYRKYQKYKMIDLTHARNIEMFLVSHCFTSLCLILIFAFVGFSVIHFNRFGPISGVFINVNTKWLVTQYFPTNLSAMATKHQMSRNIQYFSSTK